MQRQKFRRKTLLVVYFIYAILSLSLATWLSSEFPWLNSTPYLWGCLLAFWMIWGLIRAILPDDFHYQIQKGPGRVVLELSKDDHHVFQGDITIKKKSGHLYIADNCGNQKQLAYNKKVLEFLAEFLQQ